MLKLYGCSCSFYSQGSEIKESLISDLSKLQLQIPCVRFHYEKATLCKFLYINNFKRTFGVFFILWVLHDEKRMCCLKGELWILLNVGSLKQEACGRRWYLWWNVKLSAESSSMLYQLYSIITHTSEGGSFQQFNLLVRHHVAYTENSIYTMWLWTLER